MSPADRKLSGGMTPYDISISLSLDKAGVQLLNLEQPGSFFITSAANISPIRDSVGKAITWMNSAK